MTINKSVRIFAVLTSLLLICILPITTSAFDGHRKGFVMGFGLGGAPISHWSVKAFPRSSTEQGFAGGFLLGYAWNDNNMIVYGSNVSFFSSEDRQVLVCSQAVDAITLYHYFGGSKHRRYFKGGIGYSIVGSRYSNIGGDGIGFVVGSGFELFKQVELGANLFSGSGKDQGNYPATAVTLSFTVTAVAY